MEETRVRPRRTLPRIALAAALCWPAFAAAEQPAAPSPGEAAMMAAFERAAAPGEQHAWLQSMAGEWDFEGTFWMAPGAEPMRSTGSVTRTALLGGRVLKELVKSSMMGQPFEGMGFTGYDNVAGHFWGTWFDNMSTSLMTMTGTCTDGNCTFDGTNTDPMTGEAAPARMVSKHAPDREVHEMWGPGPDGQDFKMMELVYTRRK
jgi:hypothetical protein